MKVISLIVMVILLCGVAEAKSKRRRSHTRKIPVQIIKDYGNGRFNIEVQLPELLDFFAAEGIKPRIGQQPIHNVFSYAHLNAMDVGVSPKSSKGKRLLQYLKSKFIPFLAITGRKKGVSTGPHVHIGFSSPRTKVKHPIGKIDGKFNHVHCPFYRNGAICF